MTNTTESEYYAFMRFDAANARKVLSFYTQFFDAGPVIELACGPGAFLDLLREKGVDASGVDIDEGMAQVAREAGHHVELADATTHLATQPDGAISGLFAAHFLEHLPSEQVQALYHEAARVLAPGGVFVAAVPNPACLSVLGHDFWRDPTHVRFYDLVALHFFATQAGLGVVAQGENLMNHPGPPPDLYAADSVGRGSVASHAISLVQHAQVLAAPQAQPAPASGVRWRYLADALDRSRQAAARQTHEATVDQSALWSELGNILSALDDRIQTLQHDLFTLRSAYGHLLAQLYPANEVYLVAKKPAGDELLPTVGDLPALEGMA